MQHPVSCPDDLDRFAVLCQGAALSLGDGNAAFIPVNKPPDEPPRSCSGDQNKDASGLNEDRDQPICPGGDLVLWLVDAQAGHQFREPLYVNDISRYLVRSLATLFARHPGG
ncbi:MAG: hypothetical protein CME19_16545 [Gemmatimonadetes bacterium]|nr:hypothetical protein [Gemmatimonadota bacterium]